MAASVLPAQALDIHKQDTRSLSHLIVGVYCEGLGDFEGAVDEYQKALETDPESFQLHLNLASVFIRKNNTDLAVKELKHSIGIAPEAVQPHALLALIYAAQNKANLATGEYVLALENAAQFEPENIDIYKGLGVVYLQQKKLKQAESIFKLILKMAPEDPEAYFHLGVVDYDLKNYASAEKQLKSAIKLKPDYSDAYNNRGISFKNLNRIDESLKDFNKAIELNPQYAEAYFNRGSAYDKAGKYEDAISDYTKGLELNPNPVIYYNRGIAKFNINDKNGACYDWMLAQKDGYTQASVVLEKYCK